MPANYKGVPIDVLQIDAIYWSDERAEHIRTRSKRKESEELNIEPEWATQAALDPHRRVGVPASNDPASSSLAVIGFSPDAPPSGQVLKVWIWSDEPASSGTWNGGSATLANYSARRAYEEGQKDGS